MSAAGPLQRAMRSSSPEHSASMALHLAAATAAAAAQDRGMATTLLATACGIADPPGTLTTSEPRSATSTSRYTLSPHVRLGDPKAAVQAREALDPASIPIGLVGRRTQVNLDLARAYAMRRQDAAAVNLLLAAERLSPQLVRYDPITRDVLADLLRREHRPSTPELRPLARRAGLI